MEVSVIDPKLNGLPLPGKCYYCGAGHKEQYLDTGIQIEFYGALLFCEECSAHLASKLDYITPDRANNLKNENKRLKAELAEAELKFIALEQALNALKVSGHLDDDNRDSSDSSNSNPELGFPESADFVVGALQERERTMEQEGRDSAQSSDEQGLANVPTTELQSEPFDW